MSAAARKRASPRWDPSWCVDCFDTGWRRMREGRSWYCADHRRKRRAYYQARWKAERDQPGVDYPDYDARLKPSPNEAVSIGRGELERLDAVVSGLRGLTEGYLRQLGPEMPQRTARAVYALGARTEAAADEVDAFLRRVRGFG